MTAMIDRERFARIALSFVAASRGKRFLAARST